MRIAFYAPLKPPTHITPSGDRRVARLLMEALRTAGHEVTLVSEFRSYEGKGDSARQAEIRDQGSAIAHGLLDQWRAAGAHTGPELWFTYHLYYKAPDWLGPAVSKALVIPYAVAEASYAAKRADGAWAAGHAAISAAIQAAALLLCPTRDDVEGLQQVAAVHTQLVRLPPFLDPTPYRTAAQTRAQQRTHLSKVHGLDTRQTWLLVVAMMRSGDKLASYRQLAQALAKLSDVPWQILVAGDGQARAEVHRLLEGAARGRARFLGPCDADSLAKVYAACDICIWPAVNEAYGMAMLEAQAAGIPVVGCAVRGVPDVVRDGETGLLAAPGDTAGLAKIARELIVDVAKREAMGRAAARFVLEERSVLHAANQLNLAFNRLRKPATSAGTSPLSVGGSA